MKYRSLDLLLDYQYLGKEELPNGTLLIGKAPHIAPMAWLHSIYAPLKLTEIEQLEEDCKHTISDDYKDFLLTTNGLAVFNTTFSLYGKRDNYIRNVENAWQPFDIVTPNTFERPKNAKHNFIIIGSYSYDGSKLYIDNVSGKVYLCDRYDATPLYEWSNFETMLASEIARLCTLFDEEGKKLVKSKSTLPIG